MLSAPSDGPCSFSGVYSHFCDVLILARSDDTLVASNNLGCGDLNLDYSEEIDRYYGAPARDQTRSLLLLIDGVLKAA